jgi:hypothetical protein
VFGLFSNDVDQLLVDKPWVLLKRVEFNIIVIVFRLKKCANVRKKKEVDGRIKETLKNSQLSSTNKKGVKE